MQIRHPLLKKKKRNRSRRRSTKRRAKSLGNPNERSDISGLNDKTHNGGESGIRLRLFFVTQNVSRTPYWLSPCKSAFGAPYNTVP